DACEQQMIEVETTWRGYAQAIAASQEDVGWNGFEYDQVLTALQANPMMTGEQLAIELARSMTDWTSAAVALNEAWDTLLRAVDEWSIALLDGLPTYQSAYDKAYKFTQAMADPTNKDLYDAAKEIKARVSDPSIQAKSQAVMDAVTAVVLYEWHKNGYKDAHGIGIFWPRTRGDLDEPSSPENDFEYYRTLLFAQRTHWDEFIAVYADRDR
ncbi:MAG: clostripain-related cysteine peptidase, partial [Chloroflexia bacterium]